MTRRKVKAKRQPSGPPRGRGRPSEFSEAVAERLCEALASGQSMRKACEPKDMPAPATVYRWLAQKKDFRERYTRAREAQADLFFDQILEIADDATGDVKVIPQKDGSTVTKIDHENVHRARLRVDARKWIVARLAPKKYGDEHAVFAPHLDDEGKPVGPVLNIIYEKPRDEEERRMAEEAERRRLDRH